MKIYTVLMQDLFEAKYYYILVIYCSMTVVPELKLGELSTKDEILDKIKNIEFLGGNTNTGEALSYIREKAFTKMKSPYNSTKPRIAIILTDGQSNDVHRTMAEASKAKREGIALFVIGIGKQVIIMFFYVFLLFSVYDAHV
jgi:hypothetical protein